MNTIAYLFYFFFTYLVTVHVGLVLYRNGRVYILALMGGDAQLTDAINKLLLTGYYLLNLGYAALMLRSWKTITSAAGIVASVAAMTGRIILTLAVIHYFNMTLLYLAGKKRNKFDHHKKSTL